MQPKNKSVIYWKWDDAAIESDLEGKIEDLCSRMDVGTVFIGLHWIKHRFHDKEVQDALRLCCRELHRRGIRLVSEACPRNEAAEFFEKNPGEVAYLTAATELTLDGNGHGETVVDTMQFPHYWRSTPQYAPVLINAFLFEKTGDNGFAEGSQRSARETVTMSAQDGNHTLVRVDAGAAWAGKTAAVFVGIPQPIPDLATNAFGDFYRGLVTSLQEVGADGVMSDEWGYDVIIKIEDPGDDPDFYKKREIYFQHITWSAGFARDYAAVCGRDLTEDLLRLFYSGEPGESIGCVNAYHEAFRGIMRRNDEMMYDLCKEVMGPDTFYGVHPTWWGNNYLQNFEGFKNGFYWWEAKRDIAQTDEIVIMPIRTALAHKWGGDCWYNMWYSMGTRDIRTYFRETWSNVRFCGRTHYLAYECPNEDVVLELKPQGLLEQIEDMDSRVRLLDRVQNSMPDCRVLVLFGMQNALNWFYNDRSAAPWYPRHKVLTPVLECVDKIGQKFLCDMVPTTEIENGSLFADHGKARYGSQEYDAVVLLAPDSMKGSVYAFLEKLDPQRLIVAGGAERFSSGRPLTDRCKEVLDRGVRLDRFDAADEIMEILERWNIRPNRFENGCVLQDGSLVFTAEGKKAVGNPLDVEVVHEGISVSFHGEDVLFLKKDGERYLPVYPKGELLLNGALLTRNKERQK